MNDLVSIIMPSYNTAQYIAETIKTVQAQSYKNWELIIVDDCSEDSTNEIVKSFLTDNRIKFFINEKNFGAAYSRNYALRKANGRWIAFLDSDDLWLPEKLELQIEYMEENEYSFTYTNYSEIDEENKPLGIIVTGPRKITKEGMFNYCWPGCLTVMFDYQVIGLIQIEDIKKNNDYAMWLKVCKKTDCFLLDKELARYRKRKGSISNTRYTKLVLWHYKLFHENEEMDYLKSIAYTLKNIVYGIYKKQHYVLKEKRF